MRVINNGIKVFRWTDSLTVPFYTSSQCIHIHKSCAFFPPLFFLILSPSSYVVHGDATGNTKGSAWVQSTGEEHKPSSSGAGQRERVWSPQEGVGLFSGHGLHPQISPEKNRWILTPTGLKTSILKCLMLNKQGLSMATFFLVGFWWNSQTGSPTLLRRPGLVCFHRASHSSTLDYDINAKFEISLAHHRRWTKFLSSSVLSGLKSQVALGWFWQPSMQNDWEELDQGSVI